jgi:allantoinase
MPSADLVIRGHRVVARGRVAPAAIHVREGRIARLAEYDDVPDDCELFEAGERVLMAGLVDSHVHVNEPGRTDWEGFETATRAAAAGGVTTIVDMPLNSIPPTTTLDGLRRKLDAARGKCAVDVAFWGGLVPGNTQALAPLDEAGVVGFKCFLIESGVEEFPHVTERDLRAALPELARLDATLIAHAELPEPVARASAATGDPRRYETFLRSRPRAAEDEAVALLVRLCREFGVRVHVVHHSSADALPLLRQARAEGLRLTAETCPHYLTLEAEGVPEGATEFKCCPPIRERENREQLWRALGEGLIEMVVSDHSPCPPALKRREEGDFMAAWGGISSLQLRLPLVWTEARERGHTLLELTSWLSDAPARLAGLGGRKGAIEEGFDADFCVWDDAAQLTVEPATIHHKHKLTPYLGRRLTGIVVATFLRGRRIYEHGEIASPPAGLLLARGRAREFSSAEL